ncbi:MAG: alpha/beta hydrolase [Acidobacteria bacterium]|nr:alpha/beta hydrolase [Acidobacteriota bacterium]
MLLLASCASAIRSRIFLPEPMPSNISWSGRAPQEVTATTDDGLTLRGYYWPPHTEGGDLILFFHGQSGNRYRAARMAAPLAAGGGLLVASYRGYGDNPGTPDAAGLYADARAFLSLARTLAPKSRLYLFGFSLGAAPALRTAADEEVAGVITLGAFTALEDVAPAIGRHLLPDRFDNRASIARVTEPILLLHAIADEVVPFAQAEELRALAPQRARLLRLEGGGHRADMEFLAPIVWDNIRQMPR